jgi:hypothetical protein
LLVIVRLPVAALAAVGLNVKATVEDCPALITLGVVIPLNANPVPETDTPETVRSEPPVFEIVRLELPCDPATTLPKLIELLLREICWLAATPVADKFTTTGAVPESPCTDNVPFTDPLAVGVTLTVRLPDCPAGMDTGKAMPLSLNWEFETVACVTVSAAVPLFEMVTIWLLDLPTPTFPKLTVAGLS